MAGQALPAPTDKLVSIFKVVLDNLVEGLGVDAVIAAATVEAPILAEPFFKQIFRFIIEKLAQVVDENLFKLGAKIIIRIQNEGRKEEFDTAMEPILNPGASADEIKRAKDAIDKLVNRNKP